jgi:hypothetical protein
LDVHVTGDKGWGLHRNPRSCYRPGRLLSSPTVFDSAFEARIGMPDEISATVPETSPVFRVLIVRPNLSLVDDHIFLCFGACLVDAYVVALFGMPAMECEIGIELFPEDAAALLDTSSVA